MAQKRVAVVGAGSTGLAAIKCCLEEGLIPVCYEITNDIAGIWNFKEDVKNGLGSAMKSTVTNISKELYCFSDFPMPSSFPNFLTTRNVKKYLNMYADSFNLHQYIHFNTEVIEVLKANDFSLTGKWKIKAKNNGKDSEDIFDCVMVCTGVNGTPFLPDLPGRDQFQGKIIHNHEVRDTKCFEGKRVLIIGAANSGIDTAVEISRVADQVYVSTRRTSWYTKRVADYGIPYDLAFISRFIDFQSRHLPASFFNYLFERKCKQIMDHDLYGLSPKERFCNVEPSINDELPSKIMSGEIIIHHGVTKLDKNSVSFEDGGKVDNIDYIVCATGYNIQYPFINKDILSYKDNEAHVYKYCFLPELEHHTLALIGSFFLIGPYFPTTELQSRWVTRVFKGLVKLPSKELMIQDISKENADRKQRFAHSQRYNRRMNFYQYIDEISASIGCNPNIGEMIKKDPVLAWKCFFGPLVPSQFRLKGPGRWAGARDTIMHVWDRVLPINKNGVLVYKYSLFDNVDPLVLAIGIVIIAYIVFQVIV